MRVSDAFPSDYLKAADLRDRNVLVAIDRVEMKDIGDDHKPVLYFQGKDKGLVLNKTNSNNISAAYGDEMDDWAGKEIVLYPAMTDFQGKSVPCIRVRPARAADKPKPELRTVSVAGGTGAGNYPAQAAASRAVPEPPPIEDSDVPF